jgi:hypothetical protein
MSWGAVIIGGSAILGGVLANQGAKSAASTAAGAANNANALSDAQFQQTRTDMAPWRNAGGSAIGQLSYLVGLPGYGPAPAPTGQLRTLGQTGAALPAPGQWSPSGPVSFEDIGGRRMPGSAMQKSIDEPTSTTFGGSSGMSPVYDSATGQNGSNPWDGATITSAGIAPNTYNTQLGDFGSLSRDFSMADFQADPGLQFRMDRGQQALERSAAAGGRFLGGGTLKALTRYGQDFGSQEYGNAFNRFQTNRNTRFNQLAAVAGIGQTANGQLAQLGQTNALTQGNNLMGAATVGGNAAMAGAAGWSSALNNGVNNWLTYQGYKG